MREETGIADVSVRGTIDTIDWYFRFRGRLIHKVCHFFLMETAEALTSPQQTEGITACQWVSFDAASIAISYANARDRAAARAGDDRGLPMTAEDELPRRSRSAPRDALARTAPPRSWCLRDSRARRALMRGAFPRRRARLVLTRTPEELDAAFRASLVDAAVVDLAGAQEETWRAAALAREFPSVPFFGLTALARRRSARASAVRGARLRRCAGGVGGRQRGARPRAPPRLFHALQRGALRAAAGAGSRHAAPARRVALHRRVVGPSGAHAAARRRDRRHARASQPHVRRGGAPNLKRVIDLVRLIAAAELAKNPGYDVRDVAKVLDFASSSHLSSTAQRVVGMKPASLARLRAVDLIERFTKGHGRSRG